MSDDKRIGQWFRIMWEGRQINVCVRAIIQHPWHGELAELYPQTDGSGPYRIVAQRLRGVQKMSAEEREAELHRNRINRSPFETLKPQDTPGTVAALQAARAASERARRDKNNALNREKVKAGIRKHRYAPSVSLPKK